MYFIVHNKREMTEADMLKARDIARVVHRRKYNVGRASHKISKQFGENAVDESTIWKWFAEFDWRAKAQEPRRKKPEVNNDT